MNTPDDSHFDELETLPEFVEAQNLVLPSGPSAPGDVASMLLQFTALHNEYPATNYATLDFRNAHPVLDFDAATNESAVFAAVMPRHYTGSGLQVFIHYAMTSATTGNVRWEAAFERIGDEAQDLDTDSFATAMYGLASVPADSGLVDIISIEFTNGTGIDSLAVGDGFRLKITRNAAHADDTATGDAELRFVEVCEQDD